MEPDYPPNCNQISRTSNICELIKDIKCLSETLQESNTNQEDNSPDRYKNLYLHLTKPEFLNHPHDDFRIWLACCIADIFRIFAPNVPFDDSSQLKGVLSFLINTLKGLENPCRPLFRRYFYLLENLATLKTLILALQLPGEEPCLIIKKLIKTTMDIINSREWTTNREVSEEMCFDDEDVPEKDDDKIERKEKIHQLLSSAIIQLIGEADTISFTVMDVLFFYLINPQKANYRESYFFAKNIVQAVHGNLDVPVENLLTRSLLVGGLPEECEHVGSSLKKLYDVIIELHEAVPSLVTPVIPQIGNFLKEDNEDFRLSAMKAVAVIAQNPNSRLLEDHNTVWNAYIERARDAAIKIRTTFAKQSLNILLNSAQLRGSVCAALCRLLNDTEESIRLEALQAVFDAARRKLECVNEELIQTACERLLDQKQSIRLDAIQKLLTLYGKVISGEEYTSSDIQVVNIIAEKALKLYRTPNMKEEQNKLERYLAAFLIPYKMEASNRVQHMISLHAKLPQVAADNLRFIIMRNCSYRRLMKEILIVLCKEDLNTDVKTKEIEQRIERIAKEQIHPLAFGQMMRKMSNFLGDERKAFDQLSYIVGTETVCSKVSQTVGLFLQTVQESKKFFTKDEHVLIRHFLERLAPIIMDSECAELMVIAAIKSERDLGIGKEGSELYCFRLLTLMSTWAEQLPHIFLPENVQEELRKMTDCHTPHAVCTALEVMKHSYNIPKVSLIATEPYKEVTKELLLKVILLEDPLFSKCSKLGVFTFTKMCRKEESLEAFNNIWAKLTDRVDIFCPCCVNAMRALMAIFKIFPDEFEERYQRVVTELVVAPIVLSSEACESDPEEIDLTEERFTRMKIPKYTYSKIFGLKMLCRLLNGKPEHDSLAQKTLKVLSAFLEYDGNISKEETDIAISPVEMAMIRATAGGQLLRMAVLPKYQNLITLDQYIWLGNLMTDGVHAVRKYIASKLINGFQKHTLIVEYMAFYALLPILKEKDASPYIDRYVADQHIMLKLALTSRLQMLKMRNVRPQNLPFWQPEYVVAYACFLLAVNPVCGDHLDVYNMELLRECLWFLIEIFYQNRNTVDFVLMNRVFEEVRQNQSVYVLQAIKDGKMSKTDGQTIHKKMWALADLGMSMIAYRAKLLLNGEPAESPVLSLKFFKKLSQPNEKLYAPQEMIADEEKRNGKLPMDRRKKMNGSSSGISKLKSSKTVEKDDDSLSKEKVAAPRTPKRRGKRKPVVVEFTDEENISESEEEVMPGPSKRRLVTPSEISKQTNKETITKVSRDSYDVSSPKKRNAPIPLKRSLITRNVKGGISLEDLPFSPILKSTPSAKHAVGVKRGFISSTPLQGVRTRNVKLNVNNEQDQTAKVLTKHSPKKADLVSSPESSPEKVRKASGRIRNSNKNSKAISPKVRKSSPEATTRTTRQSTAAGRSRKKQ